MVTQARWGFLAYSVVVVVGLVGTAQIKPVPAVLVLFLTPGWIPAALLPGVHSDWAITAAAAYSAAFYITLVPMVSRIVRRFRRQQQ